jgi:uncharacterized protein YdhG (YjbR/CyaY superfamily)
MMSDKSAPRTIDEYIAEFPPKIRSVLNKIKATVKKAAPQAEEKISYRMPAFFLNGVLIYFAAFKNHIGVYPPVRGDEKLIRAIARHRCEKGNLKFPLDEPIPYGLIGRIVKSRVAEQLAKANAKRKRSRHSD